MKTTIQIILRATPGVYSSYHQSLQYATGIPFNARDINASITVIDAMFEPFDQYKTKDDVIDMMSKESFLTEEMLNYSNGRRKHSIRLF